MSQLANFISPGHIAELFIREVDTCENNNEYNGEYFGARISAVFVVLIASAFGSFFPVLSSKYSFIRMPPLCFFVAKFFGSGVIIATAFIHLLQPASASLSNDCLGYPFDVYPFAFGICLIVIMLMFFLELIAYRWIESKISKESIDLDVAHTHSHFGNTEAYVGTENNGHSHSHEQHNSDDIPEIHNDIDGVPLTNHELRVLHFSDNEDNDKTQGLNTHDQITHSSSKKDNNFIESGSEISDLENQVVEESLALYTAQILNVFVLEFGIIFHSIFVGLTLSCSGNEFISLYIVVVFHQMFEGLGLGTRVACVDWPRSKRWTPWLLCLGYTLSTPIAIAIGIGVRNSYPPGSRRALITNGVFDSVSAGILVYTGLVELMAHEFLFSDEFKGPGGFKKMIWAYLVMCFGAGVMALLGRWA